MDPIVTASLIGAGSSILGGAFGGGSSERYDWKGAMHQMDINKQLMYEQMRINREFDAGVIRRRVADAKMAGLHPLYAMGAQSGMGTTGASTNAGYTRSSSDNIGAGLESAGQKLASGVLQYNQMKQQKKYNNLINEKLKAEIDETRARTKNFVEKSNAASLATRTASNISGVGVRATPNISTFKTPVGKFRYDNTMTPVQEWEDQYGELISLPMGVGLFANDSWKNNIRPRIKVMPKEKRYHPKKSLNSFKSWMRFNRKWYDKGASW